MYCIHWLEKIIMYHKIYDISVSLGKEAIDYPGDTIFSRELIWTIRDSGICDLSKLEMSAHTGTHLDTPAHFISNGKTLNKYTVKDFILPARVVEIQNEFIIAPAELKHIEIKPGEALLFKTENSRSGRCKNGVFSDGFVYMTPEAADICVSKNVGMVGIDYITIERYQDQAFPVHRKLLGNGILILESIDLSNVPPGEYTLICLPLKIDVCEASPVRAVLLD